MSHGVEGPVLPLCDRDPDDGALFPLELVYLLQTRERRAAHGHQLAVVATAERRRMRYVSWELRARGLSVAFLSPLEPRWHQWRYYIARPMSDDDLRAELAIAEDRLLRALGQMSMAFRTFDNLLERNVTPPPSWRV